MRKSKAPNKTTRGSEETSLLKKCLMGSTLLEMDGKPTSREFRVEGEDNSVRPDRLSIEYELSIHAFALGGYPKLRCL